jgi:hypothetical protein
MVVKVINSRNISDLKPYVKYLAQRLIDEANKQGLKVLITSTLRDAEYQAYLYSLGRTREGQIVTTLKKPAAHGYGLAFDICQNIKGREWEDIFFAKVGKIGVSLGLEWGGNWKSFVDKPHFQFIGGLTNEQIRAGQLPKFPEIPKPTTSQHSDGKAEEVDKVFNDLNTVSDWAKDSVIKLEALGILEGDDLDNFNPKSPITRQELAVMIARTIKYLGK